jgi:indolepyruvate ferredoxin oxidoreductase beta subunit
MPKFGHYKRGGIAMTLMKDPINLIIAGVGGQGNVLASQLIGEALVAKGYFVTIGETYGAAQRGGPVMSHVRVSEKVQRAPLIPEGRSDVILALEPLEAVRMISRYGNPDVIIAVNTRPVHPIDVVIGNRKYPELDTIRSKIAELSRKAYFLDATQIALEMGNSILANVVMVGVLLALDVLPLGKKDIEDILKEKFSGQKLEINLKAIQVGMDTIRNN